MVAHVLRLRLALLAGSLRGDRGWRNALTLLAAVAATIVVCIAVLGLASAPLATARTVIVLSGAATFIAFLIGPPMIAWLRARPRTLWLGLRFGG